MSILKKLFAERGHQPTSTSNALSEASNEMDTVTARNFDILKYDGIRALHIGKVDYAVQCLQQATTLCDDAEVLTWLVIARLNNGSLQPIEGVAMLTKALTLDEHLLMAYLQRAELLWIMLQCNEALQDVDIYLQERPDDTRALLLKATILAHVGRTIDATQLCDKLIELNPYEEDAYLLKGKILLDEKAYDAAIDLYSQAVELNPFFGQAYKERGQVYLLKGEKEKAFADARKAMELQPEEGERVSGEFSNCNQTERCIPF